MTKTKYYAQRSISVSGNKYYSKYGRKKSVKHSSKGLYILYHNRRVYFDNILRLEKPIYVTTTFYKNGRPSNIGCNILDGYIYEGTWISAYVEIIDYEHVQLWTEGLILG